MGILFRKIEYPKFNKIYKNKIINNWIFRLYEIDRLAMIKNNDNNTAIGIDIKPEAIARLRLYGCNLSTSISRMSLKIYIADAAREKAANPMSKIIRIYTLKELTENVNKKGANIRRFFK